MQGRPTVAVLRVHIAAKSDEESDDVEVAGTDGVVEGSDALVISGTGIGHLGRGGGGLDAHHKEGKTQKKKSFLK